MSLSNMSPSKRKQKNTLYKFLTEENGELVSDADKTLKWKIGEWNTYEGDLEICKSGFHASRRIADAQSYTHTEILAQVEVMGKSICQRDKEVWGEMKVVNAWRWTQKDSVEKAIFAAELVVNIFERKYPNDNKPRTAIEAAKAWLKNPTKKNARAAGAAYAAAADAPADAPAGAAHAAHAAAIIFNKIERWHIEHLKEMKPYQKKNNQHPLW